MKWTRCFWKNQLYICIATSIPFIGIAFLEIGVENQIKKSYNFLIKPYWLPKNYWVSSIKEI